jgi:hypothetical protein
MNEETIAGEPGLRGEPAASGARDYASRKSQAVWSEAT